MTREECIHFYQSLSDEQQNILNTAIMFAHDFSAILIYRTIIQSGKKITHKAIESSLTLFMAKRIITPSNTWNKSYDTDPYFLIRLFPLIKDRANRISKIIEPAYTFYIYDHNLSLITRGLLIALLSQSADSFRNTEQKFRTNPYIQHHQKVSILRTIIENDDYLPYLYKFPFPLLFEMLNNKVSEDVFNIVPFAEIRKNLEHIQPVMEDKNIASLLQDKEYLYSGQFDKAMTDSASKSDEDALTGYYLPALKLLAKDGVNESLKLFEKGLKVQRKWLKGTYLPHDLWMALFYQTALLRMDSNVYMPVFLRILKSYEDQKCYYPAGYSLFRIVSLYVTGQKINRNLLQEEMDKCLEEDNMAGLITLPVAYLCDIKTGSDAVFEKCFHRIEKADEAGYTAPALEAAYVLDKMVASEQTQKLYARIAAKANYSPFITKIVRVEEWEKSVNLLLGLQSPGTAKNNGNTDASSRIIYIFNPKYNSIQPVIQTRKGNGWSRGRNIAMKTLYEGKTPSMTPQDIRISQSIQYYSNYYDHEYTFKESVFKELIGHPYIFLEGINEIPVEFAEGKPVVMVEKTGVRYTLKTYPEVPGEEKTILIEKETNTRYKIYDIPAKQKEILRIIRDRQISIPESGKEKLLELLGALNTQGMEIHSDLVASGSRNMTLKTVTADSRIRVQLLPFGDGLKAELFCKPFGSHPPYCKPGKGGKALFRNGENDIQYQVKRQLNQEKEYEMQLMDAIQSLETVEMQDDLITFGNPRNSLYLLDILQEHSDICVVEWPEGERYRIRGTAGFDKLKLSLKTDNNWFDLKGELTVDENTVLSLQQLLALTEKGHGRFIEMSSGEFIALSNDLKKRLDDLSMFGSFGKKGIALNRFASIALDDFFDQAKQLKSDKAWKDFRRRIREVNTEDVAIPETLQTELRPYQQEGFRWMVRLMQWGAGVCLADDMGLGKTVQTLAVLLHRTHSGAALVVCPVSVIGNWISEINRFAPTLTCKTLGAGNRKQTFDELQPGDVLITSYGLLQSEDQLFHESTFDTIVLDEAHTIKNFATKTSKATMKLQGNFCIALTGTPIQNHLGEIWNLFNFINPGLLGDLNSFSNRFVKPDDETVKKRLKKLISPFMLRRTKTKVLDELPPKTEIIKHIRLSDTEMAFYEALRRQALENISKNESPAGAKHLQILAEITRLRQACCNPKLIDKNSEIPSAKLATFLEIADELVENKHRALVFSQFVTHLSIVREELDKKKINYLYLDGSTPTAEREKRVKAFQCGEGQLFLISLKAGGLGLNLTGADYVIHLDPWWNPAVEDQASDRAHRIGQKRPVTIYRLITENTIEEKIIRLHETKRDLAESLLEGSDRSARLSMNELLEVLKEASIVDS
ncbi:MAG: DEAD/DEAH box helicase [Tannerella sp.]|jgi:superfamily II DNA or RNA helicase|nr:DEAD/DEAH box helicase [Tannerella sp.]